MVKSLTQEEKEVLGHLAQAWNKFIALPNQSHHDLIEYQTAIHLCQQSIALRVARRVDPDEWNQPASQPGQAPMTPNLTQIEARAREFGVDPTTGEAQQPQPKASE